MEYTKFSIHMVLLYIVSTTLSRYKHEFHIFLLNSKYITILKFLFSVGSFYSRKLFSNVYRFICIHHCHWIFMSNTCHFRQILWASNEMQIKVYCGIYTFQPPLKFLFFFFFSFFFFFLWWLPLKKINHNLLGCCKFHWLLNRNI